MAITRLKMKHPTDRVAAVVEVGRRSRPAILEWSADIEGCDQFLPLDYPQTFDDYSWTPLLGFAVGPMTYGEA